MSHAKAPRPAAGLSEETAFGRFSEHFDFDAYLLELEYDERVGAMLREAVTRLLDARQREFEAMLERHPATAAEDARRREALDLEIERLDGIAAREAGREQERRRARVGCLVRKWHATCLFRQAAQTGAPLPGGRGIGAACGVNR
jgi:hypothetical protein